MDESLRPPSIAPRAFGAAMLVSCAAFLGARLHAAPIDVLECPHCGARRKLIAMICDGVVVRKILDHLGLPSEPPILARSRVGEELAFGA